ncbi:MAG: hypothetical protein R3244_04270, partial [Thermoanaerobaculia bacterium]|nr:hypothetical protein [Thermoanaerobaculia bacterium]
TSSHDASAIPFAFLLKRSASPTDDIYGAGALTALAQVEVIDLEDRAWLVGRRDGQWRLGRPSSEHRADVSIRLPAETAWRSYLRAIDPEAAVEAAEVKGERLLVEPFFGAVAIML